MAAQPWRPILPVKNMQKIGVFMSANADLSEAYVQAARDLGAWVGRTGRTLVYGGARKGLMEVMAREVKAAGGRVFGVVPDILFERGCVSECLDVTFRTAGLSDRKELLVQESEVLVALPGGVGTLDEVFTALARRSIGLGAPCVILYNVSHCWDGLLRTLADLHAQGLLRERPEDLIRVTDTFDELVNLLSADSLS